MFYVKNFSKIFLLCFLILSQSTSLALNNSDSNIRQKDVNVSDVSSNNQAEKLNTQSTNKVETQTENNKLMDLENDIKSYLGNNINNIGLSYYDINNGENFNINGNKTFLAASTVKVQMNMVLADMFESGQVSSDEKIQYTSDMYEDGTGILQNSDLSKPIPISILSKYSIIYSDNIATNMIINRIGYENLRNSIDSKIGHSTDHSDNYITPNDETTLLNLLYKNIDNNPYYEEIINNMKSTEFNDRIDVYIPENIVAHKIGNYDTYVNDVGIIYTSNPFILSFYTNNLDNANKIIADISKMIYDYHNNM